MTAFITACMVRPGSRSGRSEPSAMPSRIKSENAWKPRGLTFASSERRRSTGQCREYIASNWATKRTFAGSFASSPAMNSSSAEILASAVSPDSMTSLARTAEVVNRSPRMAHTTSSLLEKYS